MLHPTASPSSTPLPCLARFGRTGVALLLPLVLSFAGCCGTNHCCESRPFDLRPPHAAPPAGTFGMPDARPAPGSHPHTLAVSAAPGVLQVNPAARPLADDERRGADRYSAAKPGRARVNDGLLVVRYDVAEPVGDALDETPARARATDLPMELPRLRAPVPALVLSAKKK